jgi:ABC-type glycerol-3-phosphate transport system substrate-binding protein
MATKQTERRFSSLSRRTFLRLAGVSSGAVLISDCVAPVAPAGGQQAGGEAVAPTAARKTLRLQSSFPVDYPNTLVLAQDVFAEFKESHPDFEVEVAFVPVPDVARNFVQAMQVDQAPDFFYAFESQGTLSYLGHLHDLTDLVKDAGLWDDFYQSAKELWTTPDGKLIGIPDYFGTKCYVYRADIWQEAGLDPEKFPTTWEEFTEAAIKLTKKDAAGVNTRDGYHMFEDTIPDSEHLVQYIHQNAGSEYSGDATTGPSAINSPAALDAFTWWLDLVRVHGVESPEGSITPEGADRILDGYVGVEVQGPWWIPGRRRRRPELFDQDLIRVGAPLTRKAQIGHLDASGFAVNTHSDILEDVLDYVRIYLKDEHYMHVHDATSADGATIYQMPCSRRSINEHPDFWIAKEPLVRNTAYFAAFDQGKSTARMHLGFDEVRANVYPRMSQQGLFATKDDQTLLDEAAAEMDKITERIQKELA